MPAAREKGEITPAQSRFIHLKTMGANTTEAAKGSGITRGHGYKLLSQDNIKTEMAKRMVDSGITTEVISNKIKEGFDSMAPPRKDGGIQYPDMFTRRQYIDMAMRVLGLYAPEELNINQRVINITITPEVTKALLDSQVINVEALEELEYGSILDGEEDPTEIKESKYNGGTEDVEGNDSAEEEDSKEPG